MTLLPSNNFDIMEFLFKQKTVIRNKMGFECDIEVELGTEWVKTLEERFDSWSSQYSDERSVILGMPLRINYQNPNEVKLWANGVN